MDIIYTDSSYKEYGYLKDCEIDIEIGSVISSSTTNDFQLSMNINDLPSQLREGSLIYELNTELGGIVNGIGADTANNIAYVYGICWRGKLYQEIIEPSSGNAYLSVSGEANKAIRTLINDRFEGLIIGSDEVSEISVSYDFRYTNLLEGLEKMLSKSDAGLKIEAKYVGREIKVIVSATPVSQYSNEIEFNNDYGISMISKKISDGVNHVICLGSGELIERTVIHLYKLEDGTITQNPTNAITGLKQNTITYDFSSVESEEELIKGGTDKFDEKSNTENLDITIEKDVDIGDMIACRERLTGIYMLKQVTQKIIKGNIDTPSITYKVGE